MQKINVKKIKMYFFVTNGQLNVFKLTMSSIHNSNFKTFTHKTAYVKRNQTCAHAQSSQLRH